MNGRDVRLVVTNKDGVSVVVQPFHEPAYIDEVVREYTHLLFLHYGHSDAISAMGIYDVEGAVPSDEDEKTDPGVGPATGPLRLEQNQVKGVKCYLCSRLTPTILIRPSGDRTPVCPHCTTSILHHDIAGDGTLTPKPEE